MTHNESFPGRPRGRRARQDNGGPEWQGHDAASQDQREFPDLAPVRPREARTRDARGLPGQAPPAGQPGGYGNYPGGGGYQGGAHARPGGGNAGYGSGGYPAQGGYGGRDQQSDLTRGGQAPWPEQPPQRQAAQQVAPQPQEQRRQAEETPSWAEPDAIEEFSERWRRRGQESRAEERATQRKHRRLLIAAGSVVALAIAVTIYLLSGGPGAASLGFGNFVTTFLPGELQQVPNPCTSVPAATLNQYLPGKTKQASPPLNSGMNTECTWTLDNAPTYRVLDVQLEAYSPSGLASGSGSATFAAVDAFRGFETGFAKPGANSGQAPATVTDLTGMPGGTETSAFQATELTSRGGATIDVANVYVRYRNVIIRVVVNGLNQDSGGKTYSASMSDLTAAANTVAKEMASQIVKQS